MGLHDIATTIFCISLKSIDPCILAVYAHSVFCIVQKPVKFGMDVVLCFVVSIKPMNNEIINNLRYLRIVLSIP